MQQICVIDGQGGGIIRKLNTAFYNADVEIMALGANAIATAQMLKARANRGASGENAIVRTVRQADIIIGPIGIIMAHAMMGEITPKMAEAIAGYPAKKILLPLSQENVVIAGLNSFPLPKLIDSMLAENLLPLINTSTMQRSNIKKWVVVNM